MTEEEFLASLPMDLSEQQRAAVLAGGAILVPKQAKNGVTVAVAGRKIL